MNLNELTYTESSRKKQRRVGRGGGSGIGKKCGNGHNGQNSRSGGGVRLGFEGGQTPIYKRLPKRGFNNYTRKEYAVVNVEDLNCFNDNDIIDPTVLKEKGLAKKEYDGVKILAKGKLDKKLTVKANKFSKTAITAIENAGGKVEVI